MAQNQPDPAQANAYARAVTLATAVPMSKKLPLVNATMGGQVQIPLQRMGILTGVLLDITIPVTVSTAPAVQSQFGPFNFVKKVKYTDFAGTDRVNTNGWSLWALQSLKFAGNSSGLPTPYTGLAGLGAIDTALLHYPTAVGTADVRFQLYVPMAYDAQADLRGAVLAQTIVGEHYITLNFADLKGADTYLSPYAAADNVAVAANSIKVQATQFYLQPQDGFQSIPQLDLSTVYSIEGALLDSQGITAGQSKYLNYPNNRSVLSALYVFENGNAGTLNSTDLSQITLIANSNTNIREMDPPMVRADMRGLIGADIASGAYYVDSRRQPILTQLLGNVQTKFDVASVAGAGTVAFLSQYESFYPSGAPLPGVGGV